MYKPPLLRRLLPWLYALVFVIVAPILLFYTAGYQYNIKKRLVERSGALIVDGGPKNATIFLDGTDTGQTLPYTFQHVTPGWHTIRIEKAGYSSWEKHLEIRPEQVTFANNVHLWTTQTPKMTLAKNVLRLEADTNDNLLAVVDESNGTERIGTWNPRTQLYQLSTTERSTSTLLTSLPIRWNSEGTAFVLNGIAPSEPSYWSNTEPIPSADQLPNGTYVWSDAYTLVGSDDSAMIRLQTRSNRFTREQLSPPTVFHNDDLSIQKTTTTPPTLLLTKNSLEDRVYQLINPNLRLVQRFKDLLILTDTASNDWLALTLTQSHPYAGDLHGDYPRWFKDPIATDRHRALLINGGELWLWEPEKSATLLWRQAENLRQAVWDPDGAHIILADEKHVFALELDDRDGRITTPLAEFQNVRDMTVSKKTLYISARYADRDGIFSLPLE